MKQGNGCLFRGYMAHTVFKMEPSSAKSASRAKRSTFVSHLESAPFRQREGGCQEKRGLAHVKMATFPFNKQCVPIHGWIVKKDYSVSFQFRISSLLYKEFLLMENLNIGEVCPHFFICTHHAKTIHNIIGWGAPLISITQAQTDFTCTKNGCRFAGCPAARAGASIESLNMFSTFSIQRE